MNMLIRWIIWHSMKLSFRGSWGSFLSFFAACWGPFDFLSFWRPFWVYFCFSATVVTAIRTCKIDDLLTFWPLCFEFSWLLDPWKHCVSSAFGCWMHFDCIFKVESQNRLENRLKKRSCKRTRASMVPETSRTIPKRPWHSLTRVRREQFWARGGPTECFDKSKYVTLMNQVESTW